jgi:hypothetical protein
MNEHYIQLGKQLILSYFDPSLTPQTEEEKKEFDLNVHVENCPKFARLSTGDVVLFLYEAQDPMNVVKAKAKHFRNEGITVEDASTLEGRVGYVLIPNNLMTFPNHELKN